MTQSLHIHTIVSLPFEENTFILWRDGNHQAIVIDPGLQPEWILDFLREKQLTVAAILNTHGHADHIGGNEALKEAFPTAPIVTGKNEAHLLTDAHANLSAPFGMPITSPPADKLLQEGDIIEYASIPLEVLDLPGHSPGHVVFVYRDQPIRIFGGDVLFQGSVGRMDFPGGSETLLLGGIRQKLFPFPPDTIVYPGHGPETTIGHERKTNPYVGDEAT
jgi:hydroxyacylglutathione hydrolase